MREKSVEGLAICKKCINGMVHHGSSLVKGLKIGSNEVEGGRCMSGSNDKLCFIMKERGEVWKDYMKRIGNEGDE